MTAAVASGQWVAFNDQGWQPCHNNVTIYSLDFIRTPSSGPLPGGGTAIAPSSYVFQAIRLEELAAGPAQVQLTTTAPDTMAVAPTNLLLTALPSCFKGAVTNIAFYTGPAKLWDVPASPYSLTWSNVPAGAMFPRGNTYSGPKPSMNMASPSIPT